jgi:hypothetical protein
MRFPGALTLGGIGDGSTHLTPPAMIGPVGRTGTSNPPACRERGDSKRGRKINWEEMTMDIIKPLKRGSLRDIR